MHGAKDGGREGYRERVREREGNTHNLGGKHQRTIQGKGWVNAKIGWIFVTFNDLWGHTSEDEIFAYL